jgi:hypothetical protein
MKRDLKMVHTYQTPPYDMSRIAGVCLAGIRRRVVLQSGSQGQWYATVPPIFLPTNIQIYGTPVMARFAYV